MDKNSEKEVEPVAEPEEKKKSYVLKAETGRYKLTGSEVSAISSTINSSFEQAAIELSKKIEEVAKAVSESE